MIEPKSLTRKTSLRKATKEFSVSELETVAHNLAEILREREEEETKAREAEAEKQAKLSQMRKQMAAAGITEAELMAALGGSTSSSKSKKARGTVPPKYDITDKDGNTHQWTGRGRTPKVFEEYFKKGGSKKDCLIKK